MPGIGGGVKGRITKGHKETFEDDGLMHYLDCEDDFMGIHSQTLSN